ncbi:GIY-YIG nuclease family protein [Methylobacterium iners]|uniref:GIY-YIG nuclease family protein n=2 Tax=Methylobacterium iners TaxID=418707 RepID=A0ABQ4RQC0_9HYPH|nr:hypothetical protein OCOJLMKI_0132 [Methylobacterium iners]
MLAAYDETRKRVKRRRHRYPNGHIYFISRPDDLSYPVKVGYSGASLYMRLANVQVGCPYRLAVIESCPAHHSLELRLHLHLAESRMIGEWFARSPALAAAMRAAAAEELDTLLGVRPIEAPIAASPPPAKKRLRGSARVLEVASARPVSTQKPYSPPAMKAKTKKAPEA